MKILHIIPKLEAGGAERGVVDLATMQHAQGHQVWVSSAGGAFCQVLANADIAHLPYPWHRKNPFTLHARAKHLTHLIHTQGIDILHPHSRIPNWVAHLSRRQHNCPIITTCYAAHGMGWLGLKKHYNQSIIAGDRVIATSRFIQQYLLDHYTINPQIIRLIHRGVNPASFQKPTPQACEALRKTWQLDARPTLLFPARISQKKGQHLLLEALRHLPEKNAVQVVLIGKNDQPQYLQQLEKSLLSLPAWHSVHYQANCQNMSTAYAIANVVINAPTQPEPFGRIPLEAGISRRLTLAPRAGGFLETIVDHKTGWLFKPNDPSDLAEKILQFLTLTPDQRTEMAQTAHNHVLHHFSLQAMFERTMNVYQEIVRQTP